MIAAAIEVSRTARESDQGRGQGLKEIFSIVDEVEGAKVRVLSGHGEVLYDALQGLRAHSLDRHIGGTLIEWDVPAQARTQQEET